MVTVEMANSTQVCEVQLSLFPTKVTQLYIIYMYPTEFCSLCLIAKRILFEAFQKVTCDIHSKHVHFYGSNQIKLFKHAIAVQLHPKTFHQLLHCLK